jgi:hypothetical protein
MGAGADQCSARSFPERLLRRFKFYHDEETEGKLLMRKDFRLLTSMFVVGTMLSAAAAAEAGFTSFIIRDTPVINDLGGGQTEFLITAGGQKAALGSNDINGTTIGDISSLGITRTDDRTRFTAGSGPYVAPYLNIWVTNGLGNYAVIANEPSDGNFQSLFVDNGNGTWSYDLSFADLSDKAAKVYEAPGAGGGTSWVHALFGAGPLTFADVATLMIAAPSAAYITNPGNAVGSGAPRQLGTNVAYGVNWVFGDTLSNYVSGDPGYRVSNPSVVSAAAAVPEPSSLILLGLGVASGLGLRRRQQKIAA